MGEAEPAIRVLADYECYALWVLDGGSYRNADPRAEEFGLHLVEALGAPHEAVVAQERAMFDLVVVRVPVPPAPVGPGTLGDVGVTPGGFRFERIGLLDDRLPRRTLPSPLRCGCPRRRH